MDTNRRIETFRKAPYPHTHSKKSNLNRTSFILDGAHKDDDSQYKLSTMTTLRGGSESPNYPNDPRSNNLRQRRRRSSSLNLAESQVYLPRLIARNLPYHQSRNNMAVQSLKNHSHVYPLLLRDWFHVFLRLPTYFSVTLLLSVWTLFILIFAGIYVGIDTSNNLVNCGLGDPGFPITWGTAFAFSLETCTTVGCKQPLFFYLLRRPPTRDAHLCVGFPLLGILSLLQMDCQELPMHSSRPIVQVFK